MKWTKTLRSNCQHSRQYVGALSTLALVFILMISPHGFCGESITMSDLSLESVGFDFESPRDPTSYVPNDQEIIVPYSPTSIWSELLIEDRKGVLKQVKFQMNEWNEEEDFVEYWRIEDTGQYTVVPMRARKNYLTKNLLRYIDKRIMGEVKTAKEGTSLHKVGQVRDALRPQSKFSFSKDYKLSLRAKVLRGLVFLKFDNPYFDETVLEFKALRNPAFWNNDAHVGQAKLHTMKSFKSIQAYARTEFKFYDDNWFIELGKNLNYPGLSFVVTTVQDNTALPYSGASDKISELRYALDF